jgi:hypothetical protein
VSFLTSGMPFWNIVKMSKETSRKQNCVWINVQLVWSIDNPNSAFYLLLPLPRDHINGLMVLRKHYQKCSIFRFLYFPLELEPTSIYTASVM